MRKIIHIDMDCFYAAIEMRDDPRLRDIPLAIGGSSDRRGVIATANYPARRFGVHSAMSTAKALLLCPHLKVIPGRMELYKTTSRHLHAILARNFTGATPAEAVSPSSVKMVLRISSAISVAEPRHCGLSVTSR